MKKITVILFLCFISLVNFANENEKKSKKNTVSLTGTIISYNDAEPLVGVRINIIELDETIYTDIDGNFNLSDFPTGEYSLDIQYPSYSKKTVKATVLKKNTDLNIKLFPN